MMRKFQSRCLCTDDESFNRGVYVSMMRVSIEVESVCVTATCFANDSFSFDGLVNSHLIITVIFIVTLELREKLE